MIMFHTSLRKTKQIVQSKQCQIHGALTTLGEGQCASSQVIKIYIWEWKTLTILETVLFLVYGQ